MLVKEENHNAFFYFQRQNPKQNILISCYVLIFFTKSETEFDFYLQVYTYELPLHEKYPYLQFFWSLFSRIRT